MSEICSVYMRVKAVNPCAPAHAFVPCGNCEECQEVSRNAWAFRLGTELEIMKKRGWKIGFCTLTYRSKMLPFFPVDVWTKPEEYREIPCFSRQDVTRFVHRLRKYLWKHFRIKAIRYMICSEYGEHTQRPHYHALFCWPPVIDAVEMHRIIKALWYAEGFEYGFVFPLSPYGGKDSHGYEHKPFEVEGDGYNAAKYAAKYCCKDLHYMKTIEDLPLDRKSKLFKWCKPFHVQSRSLGLSLLDGLSDGEKLDLLLKGKSFVGRDKFVSLPLYLRNKIIFDTYYIFRPDGTRLVRRRANEFFDNHVEEIYNKKKEFYVNLLKQAMDSNFWVSRDLPRGMKPTDYPLCIQFDIDEWFSGSVDKAVDMYLSTYGVPKDRLFKVSPALQWYLRYDDKVDTSSLELGYDPELVANTEIFWNWFFRHIVKTRSEAKQDFKRKVNKVADFHKSQE